MEKYLTTKEVISILRITMRTLQTWLAEGRIRATKMGRLWRIPESAIAEFMQKYQYNPDHRKKKK